jgi:hypothetical protein
MTFKIYLYLSLYSETSNLEDPFPRRHQYLLQYVDFAETSYVYIYAGCALLDLTTHHFFYFYWPLLTLKLTHIKLNA